MEEIWKGPIMRIFSHVMRNLDYLFWQVLEHNRPPPTDLYRPEDWTRKQLWSQGWHFIVETSSGQGYDDDCRQGDDGGCRQGYNDDCRQGDGNGCRQGDGDGCRQGEGHECLESYCWIFQHQQCYFCQPLLVKEVIIMPIVVTALAEK